MIPQEELDRALARWKARKLGQTPAGGAGQPGVVDSDADSPIHEEPTRVAASGYASEVQTPPAEVVHTEVHLNDSDFEDHTHR